MMDRLEAALTSEPEGRKVERQNFSRVYLAKDALQKARMYADLARDRSGKNIECYGYLIGSPDRRSRLADDVYFAPDQDNNSAHTEIPASAVIRAGREIRGMNKRVLGWWHSHANFPTFHSGTDDDNLKNVLNQIAPSNYITTYEELDFLQGDIKKTRNGNSTIVVCDRNNTSRRLEMVFEELDENPLAGMPMEKLIVRIPMQVSYAYSVVVNAIGSHPYSEVATRNYCSTCGKDHYEARKVPLRIAEGSGLELNKKIMAKEVKSKLILPKRIFVPKFGKLFGGFKGKKDKKKSKPKKSWYRVQDDHVVSGWAEHNRREVDDVKSVIKDNTGMDGQIIIGEND